MKRHKWHHRHPLAISLLMVTGAVSILHSNITTKAVAQQVLVREVAKVIAPDAELGDQLSWVSLSRDGSILVGGAHADDTLLAEGLAMNTGSAYIFERDLGGPNNWGLRKKLQPFDPTAEDFFGWAPAISGDIIAVGTRPGGNQAISSGSVYLFQRDRGGENRWGLVKKLTSSFVDVSDQYGSETELEGDTLLVGAFGAGQGRGEIHLYGRNQGGTDNWGLINTITAPDSARADSRYAPI